jgi:DnaJ-domain-containing protein 1
MVQSGVPPSEVQRLGRSQLVDAAERLVPQWEVARILACSGAQQVLRTTPSSTGAEVKAAYRRLMVKVHPDKNSSNEAGRAMSILTESFQQLTPK